MQADSCSACFHRSMSCRFGTCYGPKGQSPPPTPFFQLPCCSTTRPLPVTLFPLPPPPARFHKQPIPVGRSPQDTRNTHTHWVFTRVAAVCWCRPPQPPGGSHQQHHTCSVAQQPNQEAGLLRCICCAPPCLRVCPSRVTCTCTSVRPAGAVAFLLPSGGHHQALQDQRQRKQATHAPQPTHVT